MSGKKPRVNPLDSRKRILIAESELNRAQMAGDVSAFAAELRTLSDRARSFGSMASSAAVLVAGLAAFRHNKSASEDTRISFWQRMLKGAGVVSTLLLAFRSRVREQKDK